MLCSIYTMRVCPGCRHRYDDPEAMVCSRDGLPLLDLSETEAPLSVPGKVKPALNEVVRIEPGVMVGDYRIENVIAEGGMGTVYSAVHPLISKRVAIKVLAAEFAEDPPTVSRFVLEARSVNHIGHHNIVDIFAIGELPDGRNYLVMELLDGLPLSGVLLANGRLPAGELLPVYEQLCDALDAAHAKGFVHRDLKPENIIVLRRPPFPFVKILDFGIAKLRTGARDATHRTAVGTVLGTPEYMAPEQCRGDEIDARTDVYALGIMLYELLTACKPFVDANPLRIMNKQLYEAPVPPSKHAKMPRGVERLVMKAIAKKPSERFSSAGALLAAMQKEVAPLPWRAKLDPLPSGQAAVETLPPHTFPATPQLVPPPVPRADLRVPQPESITGNQDETIETGDTLVVSSELAPEPALAVRISFGGVLANEVDDEASTLVRDPSDEGISNTAELQRRDLSKAVRPTDPFARAQSTTAIVTDRPLSAARPTDLSFSLPAQSMAATSQASKRVDAADGEPLPPAQDLARPGARSRPKEATHRGSARQGEPPPSALARRIPLPLALGIMATTLALAVTVVLAWLSLRS